MYALPLGFMPLQKVFINYSNINKLKPNFLNINVYNALLIFNTRWINMGSPSLDGNIATLGR